MQPFLLAPRRFTFRREERRVFPGEEKIVYFDLRLASTLGTRGFYRVRRDFSVLVESRHIFGRWLRPALLE